MRSGPRSSVSPHRTQSSRGSSTPAAARETGSRESDTSTNAQASCRSVACASKEKARLVRPEEAGPHNSTSDPRGTPPPSTASSSVTPLGWSSTEARFWNPSSPLPMRPVSSFPGFRERAIIAVCIFAFCSPIGRILLRRERVVKAAALNVVGSSVSNYRVAPAHQLVRRPPAGACTPCNPGWRKGSTHSAPRISSPLSRRSNCSTAATAMLCVS